jgi:hypothetical protein
MMLGLGLSAAFAFGAHRSVVAERTVPTAAHKTAFFTADARCFFMSFFLPFFSFMVD